MGIFLHLDRELRPDQSKQNIDYLCSWVAHRRTVNYYQRYFRYYAKY